jgi:hypothetical protein
MKGIIEKKAGDLFIDYKRLGNFKKWCNNLYLENSKLTSLEGCPQEVNGFLTCDSNYLTSLEGCPQKINGLFSCNDNRLTSLKGCPQIGVHNIWCRENNITSLEGCAPNTHSLYCNYNHIKDLHDIHRHIHSCDFISLIKNPIESHVLGLLKIKNLKTVALDNVLVADIIEKYLPLGNIFACQTELIEAGFSNHAKL